MTLITILLCLILFALAPELVGAIIGLALRLVFYGLVVAGVGIALLVW